ncbi:MAG: restriction endonuclease subunit S [Anaerostipes sp.]|nr:restriction endonuclease subunit S [Anaerostipes sp.]
MSKNDKTPELPVLSATQDRGMIKRDDNGINIFHDKKNEEGYKRVVPGQFVIHLRSFQGGFAHSAIEGITSPAYTVFGFQEQEKHDDNYWKYVFSSEEFIRRLETVTYGIRDGRSISYNEFLTMSFLYPKKDEQTRIATYLDETTGLITLHQLKLEKLQDMKKSCLQKMFPQNDEKVPEIRFEGFLSEWKKRTLGSCFDERVENMPGGELLSVTIGSGIKKFSDLDRHDNSNSDKSKYKKVCVGDIAYNSMRMWQGASGCSTYEGIVSPAYTVVKPKEGIDSQFFAYMFKKKDITHVFEVNSQGLTSDTWNLKYPSFSKIVVRVPDDIREQKKIAEFLQKLDEMMVYAGQELELTKRMKKGCLQKMFV